MNEELKDQLEGFIDDLQLIVNRYKSKKYSIKDVIKEMNATGQDLINEKKEDYEQISRITTEST
tara:strand:+ start:636 stop:827 length:192 start_codon:yes stop_codon:yes gene_type:complete